MSKSLSEGVRELERRLAATQGHLARERKARQEAVAARDLMARQLESFVLQQQGGAAQERALRLEVEAELERVRARQEIPFTLTELHGWWLERYSPAELVSLGGELVDAELVRQESMAA